MRLIDADAIPYTMLYKENFLKGTGTEARGAWKSDIDAMPTIQPERKKGKWIFLRFDEEENGNALYECPYCHMGETHCPIVEVRYCWHCGAEMEGEE